MDKEKKMEKLKQQIEEAKQRAAYYENKAAELRWSIEDLESDYWDLEELKEEE